VSARRPVRRWVVRALGLILILAVLAAILALTRPAWTSFLYNETGEETLPAQLRGGFEWLGNLTRRQPETDDFVPVAQAGNNPYGVNAFLEQEVEPAKRERAVQMIADAGFHWIRQEFPWEDIEIHGKGDFEDRRNQPTRSAWEKYDNIVDLAEKYDLELIVRLSNPPAWSRASGDEAGSFGPPDNLSDYGDFVEAVARRYAGRIHTYQIWNEPNIYPEWGEQPVSPEEYTELLKVGYTRIKAVCPDCVVLSGALAQTIPLGPRDLNDFVFLQRMYDAGAADYFDVLAVQGYGLWSGPTDRRMRPRVLNFSRPLYLREIMVKNGDAEKPIWITEMNWNASPDELPQKPFGAVTLEQQARYAVQAYERAQKEWPWVGVVSTWFFKRATDTEIDQPMYYFRLAEPDFTPMPVYNALKDLMHQPPVLYPGVHQEDHWALSYQGEWEVRSDPSAELGAYTVATSTDSSLSFTFEGTDVQVKPWPGGAVGTWLVVVDGGAEESIYLEGSTAWLARGLARGQHTVTLRPGSGQLSIDSITVRNRSPLLPWLLGAALVLAAILGFFLFIRRRSPDRGVFRRRAH
jgi:polysaccharide biosynthesis protein PslG